MVSAEGSLQLDATTRMAIGCIVAALAFELFAVGAMVWQESQAVGLPVLLGCVGVLGMGVLLASVCSFLIWFHRAYRRLEVLEVGNRRYSATWAVLGWFIPFLNLVRPYRVAIEIWERTDSYCCLQAGGPAAPPESTRRVWSAFIRSEPGRGW